MAQHPSFSVLVTVYNRAPDIGRCVRSCLAQTFSDFEIVVVDDASTDGTAAALAALDDARVRVVRHDRNRGISPARATAVGHARGEWLVIVDSDWVLFPHALARLRELIAELPAGVRMIRSCLEEDDGSVSQTALPLGIADYHRRLRWLEEVWITPGGRSDAGHCIHRSVFEAMPYFDDRRGAVEALWELNVARREPSLWVADILGRQYLDAPNSHMREVRAAAIIPRLLSEAPDAQWMAETMLDEHGAALARYAPRYRQWLLSSAAGEAFLAGDRAAGVRHTRALWRARSRAPMVWVTLTLGLLGPRALAYGKLARRRLEARRRA
jgi:hypothetical protein